MSNWHFDILKQRLITLIENAVSENPHFAMVLGEWHELPKNISHLPVVAVTLGITTLADQHYGLNFDSSTKGRYDDVPFNCYCFASACRESGYETNKYAQDLADDIKDYLETNRFNQSAYNIKDIIGLDVRESDDTVLPANIRRMIIRGLLHVERQHAY